MRWVVRVLSVVLMLVILAVGAVALIPSERVAEAAAAQFQKLTGRALTITGAVRPSVWPQLGVRTGAVSLANAPWSDGGPMLQADGLAIGVDLSALIGGAVKITTLDLLRPNLLLERGKDGRGNWEFGGPGGGTGGETGGPGTPGAGTPFTLDRGAVTDGTLRFVDHAAGTTQTVTGLDADLRVPDFAGAATLQASGTVNGQPLKVTLDAAEFATALSGKVSPLTLALTAGAARVGFDGRAGFAPLAAEGRLDADLADLAAVSALAGIARPALPQGFGAGKVAVAGALTLTPRGTVHLRGGTVTLDATRLSLEADLATGGARPKLSAQVAAGALALPSSGTGGSGGGGAGWPTAAIDVSGLSALDAEVALSADSLDLGVARLGKTRVLMTLDRGRAVFDIREAAAYDGRIAGQFVVNGRSGLSVGGDLALSGLAMRPLLNDLAGYDRLSGSGDLRLKFLGVGNSVDAIMKGLSGSGSIAFGKGELRGLDIAGMLRTLDTNYVGAGQSTIFDAISASFTIAGGVLSNEDLVFTAPLLTATGAGAVDLGGQALDYRVQPTALTKADGTGGVKVPLLITGTWAAPKFRLDLESLAREKLDIETRKLEEKARAEAKRLEEEAKAKLAAKAKDALGLEVQPGETVEDAARRRAEEAINDQAGKLLQDLLGGANP